MGGEPDGQPAQSPSRSTILVVEDDVLIRFMIADDLLAGGFEVIQAASADEALKVLCSSVAVDLLLTDIRMPGSLDGLELAARARVEWPGLRIVVLSGDLPAMPHVTALADAFLPKPYSPSAVLLCVQQLVSNGNGEF